MCSVRGCVIEYRAFEYPYTTSTEHEPKQQRTARAGALMTHHPACVSHHTGGVPVNTHSTPVPLRREAVGGSAQTHNTRQRQTMSPDLYPLRPVYAIAGKLNRINSSLLHSSLLHSSLLLSSLFSLLSSVLFFLFSFFFPLSSLFLPLSSFFFLLSSFLFLVRRSAAST